jgi:carboxyl-terminal processing protease
MPINLVDGSELRLTIARYYTPTGRSIQKPYIKGEGSAYGHDLMDRYENGEFFHEDSIQFNDSLKFTTPKGRIVYGGGGIMPDKFVAYDSTMNTSYFNDLITTRALREVTLSFYLKNREKLEKYKKEQFISDFKVSDKMMKRLIEVGSSFGAEYNEEDYLVSEEHIRAYLKAEIARSLWGDQGFFPVYNDVSNGSYGRALTMFDEAQALLLK